MKRGCLPQLLCLALLLVLLLWRMLGAPITAQDWAGLSTPFWQARMLLPSRMARMALLWPFLSPQQEKPSAPTLLEPDSPENALLSSLNGSGDQAEQEAVDRMTLQVWNAQAGRMTQLPLGEYVCSVVAAEMPASYHLEALKAQAVAARTRAVAQSAAGGGAGCSLSHGADICTDSAHCQGFADVAACRAKWGDEYEVYRQRVAEAVRDTAGQILTYEGKPITVLFHAISGGMTEDASTVFSQRLPYLVSVESKGEEGAQGYSSDAVFSFQEAARLLDATFPGDSITSEQLQQAFGIAHYTPTGRVDTLFLGDRELPATEVRRALGLRSTWFSLSMDAENITFHQRGYGHGVGMSQAGANAMAAQSNGYQAILAHYYPGTALEVFHP